MPNWRRDTAVPFYLQDRFELVSASIWNNQFVLAIPSAQREWSISRKLLSPFHKATNGKFALLTDHLTPRERNSLIRHQLAFIVPDNQLFLPPLGIDLRERFPAAKLHNNDQLSPTAQMLIIAHLLGHTIADETASSLARRYRYSAMGMTRALDDLEENGLLLREHHGKAKHIIVEKPRLALWDKARPLLRNPIRKERGVGQVPSAGALRAGQSALSNYTMINPPDAPVYAIPSSHWKDWARQFPEVSPWDQQAAKLQTWAYDPRNLTDGTSVDRLSLWLSIRDDSDPRMQEAADQLLEQIEL